MKMKNWVYIKYKQAITSVYVCVCVCVCVCVRGGGYTKIRVERLESQTL